MQTRARASVGAAVLGLGLLLTPAAGAAGRNPQTPRSERALSGLLRWVEVVMDKVTQKEGRCGVGEVSGVIDPDGCRRASGGDSTANSEFGSGIDPDG